VVRNTTAVGNGGGIFTESPSPDPGAERWNVATVEGCLVHGNQSTGLLLASGARVTDTVIQENGGAGVRTGELGTIERCRVDSNAAEGIAVTAKSLVRGCSLRANGAGIIALFDSSIEDCQVVGNSGVGIRAGPGCAIRRCTATDNVVGIHVEGAGGVVDGCTVERNLSHGVEVTQDTIVSANSVIGNLGSGIRAAETGNRVDGNNVNRNALGVEILGPRNLIVRNSLDTNGQHLQIVPGNFQGPFLKNGSFVDGHPWANFDLSFPGTFP
jgi:hypothetical protein